MFGTHFGLLGFFLAYEVSRAPFTAISIWYGITEKVEHHLLHWKKLHLSRVIGYFLSLFLILAGVASHIEKL